MLIGKIHPGSGLGDQLFSYIVTRVIALGRGYDFGFVGKEFFKGKDFMQLDWGKELPEDNHFSLIESKGEITQNPMRGILNKEFKFDKPYYDPEVNFIEDGTVIDGYGAQDERYWGHRLDEIREWLKVEPLELFDHNSTVVVNFRGGEYSLYPELFLTKDYWSKGFSYFQQDRKFKRFEIHTDDIEGAKKFFPHDKIVRDIELNWRALRYAKYAIISNSAFAIIPRLLSGGQTVAPRYWAGRNVGEWRRPQNYYKQFQYI